MKAFRNNNAPLTSTQESRAAGIADSIISRQKQIAGHLNRLTVRLPHKVRMAVLLVLFVLFAGYNLYLLIHSITQ